MEKKWHLLDQVNRYDTMSKYLLLILAIFCTRISLYAIQVTVNVIDIMSIVSWFSLFKENLRLTTPSKYFPSKIIVNW